MTTDRERILELLRKIAEQEPEMRIGQIVEAAAMRCGSVSFYVDDRKLVYGLLDVLRPGALEGKR